MTAPALDCAARAFAAVCAFLQDSLSGDSKTLMLVHLRPTADNISETLCTLNFATRVRSVEMKKADAREASRVAGSRGL